MNRRGELELKDFGTLFLIYILLMTTIATSTDISIQDNSSLPSPQEEPTKPEDTQKDNNITTEEPQTPEQEEPTKPEETQNQTHQNFQNQTPELNESLTNQTKETQDQLANLINETAQNQTHQNFQNQTPELNESLTNQTKETQNQTTLIQETQNQTNQEQKNYSRIELIQHQAILNQPVKWTKRIYFENSENETKSLSTSSSSQEYEEIIYETQAPKSLETPTQKGKQIIIYSEEHYKNVTAFTNISETLNIQKPSQIKIIWEEENQEIVPNSIQDNNHNGIVDYIEWTVPHLSNQTFQIILITKASHLDQNKNFLSSIYEEVKDLDGIYSPIISENEFVRITFEGKLDNTRDITIYPKIISGTPTIEVYEVNKTEKIAEFAEIEEGENKIYLSKLSGEQDTFDLKILNGQIQFDQIIDPELDIEDFEAYSTGTTTFTQNWTNVGGDQCSWHAYLGTTPSGGTGPSIDHTLGTSSGIYAYMETSTSPPSGISDTCGTEGYEAFLESENLDADTYNITLDFWYHMYGANMGTLHLDIYTEGAWQTDVWSQTQNIDSWYNQKINLGEYEGTIKLRFRGTRGADYDSDMALDDINLSATIRNTPPTTPTSLKCNGGPCSIFVNKQVELNCSGSTDQESDQITYFIEKATNENLSFENSTYSSKSNISTNVTDWGDNVASSLTTTVNWLRCMGGTFENLQGAKLTGIYVGSAGTGSVRLAVYQGGTLSDPNGATLIWDAGPVAAGTGFIGIQGGSASLSANEATWVCVKGNDASFTVSYESSYESPSNFQSTRGRWAASGLSTDETQAYESTISGAGTSFGNYWYDFYLTYEQEMPSSEQNTTSSIYENLATDCQNLQNINITIETDSYNPSTSVDQSTTKPDLYLEAYNGASYEPIGKFNLPSTYTSDSLDTTNYNFTLALNKSNILNAWKSAANQKIRIKAISVDSINSSFHDEINYSKLLVEIKGSPYSVIGNHTQESSLTWNTTSLYEYEGINFSCTARDITGSNESSAPYSISSTLTIDHTFPKIEFTTGTLPSTTIVNSDSIYINLSTQEINFKNITFNLYNDLYQEVESNTFTTKINERTWTELSDRTYYYNATICDKASNCNSTETRQITLDRINPSAPSTSPSSGTHSNSKTQNLTINASDSTQLKEAILNIFNSTDALINQTTIPISGLTITIGIVYTFLYDGIYKWFYKIVDAADNFYTTENQTIIIDTTPSNITLKSILNNSGDIDGDINFDFNITDELSNIINCTLILNEIPYDTKTSVQKQITQTFSEENIPIGSYNWSISCYDEAENLAESEKKYFYVIKMDSFSGQTTNVSSVDITNISDFTLENSYGQIKYNKEIDISGGLNLDSLVQISQGFINVDTTSQASLNEEAVLKFYNFSYEFLPIIYKNNQICQDCSLNFYSSGNLSFNITSFSNYSIEANSKLEIFDETDLEDKYQNEDVKIFANYTNTTSGQPIDGANSLCNITIFSQEHSMSYNETSKLYEYNQTFPLYGIHDFTIDCLGSEEGYENITLQDDLTIKLMGDESTPRGMIGYRTQSGTHSLSGADEFIALDYPVNITTAFVIAPNLMNQANTTPATSGTPPALSSDDAFVTLYLYNSTHIRAQRNTADYDIIVTWQVLEATNGEFTVQRGEHSLSGTSTSTLDIIPNQVNTENSMSWFYIRTSYTSNDGDSIQFYSNITNSTTIEFNRAVGTSTNVDFRWIVVEWNTSKINSFQKGYTGEVTGDYSSPDCFILDTTINKSSSIMFHQTHAISSNGLDTSTRAGYIQDDSSICFYDDSSTNTAGEKWYVIDFGQTTGRDENTYMGEWTTDTYSEDAPFSKSYETNNSVVWVSSICDGDGTAKPRHTNWWNFNETSLHIERTYGGQPRSFSWQILELPFEQNLDSPVFQNASIDKQYAAQYEAIRFTLNVTDSDGINWTKGVIDGIERSFIKGTGDLWYYDYECQTNGVIELQYVSAKDLGSPSNVNSTQILSTQAICDITNPIVNFQTPPTPQDATQIPSSSFQIALSITEANFAKVTYQLYNSSSLINQTNYTSLITSIQFNLPQSGTYYYNATVYDKSGNLAITTTRSLTTDFDNPLIEFVYPTKSDADIVSSSSIKINTSVIEPNEANITFTLFDSNHQVERGPHIYYDKTRFVQWNFLSDATYYYNVSIYDTFSNFNSTETRSITLDTISPIINYISPTQTNGTAIDRNFITVKVNSTDIHFKNITFSLYNQTSLVGQSTFTDSTRQITWNTLPESTYYYNVTSFDEASNKNSTTTRTIILDTTDPEIDFASGTEANYANLSQTFVYINTTITETNFKNITFYIYDQSGLVDSYALTNTTHEHTFTNLPSKIYYYNATVYDKADNYKSTTTRQIGLDTIGPSIQIVNPKPIAYGTDKNLPLDYIATDEISQMDSCWWNLDNGANQTIICGTNTTFNTTDGQRLITFYANDTFGHLGKSSVSFLVSTGGPAIVLLEPEDETIYQNPTLTLFNYTAEDLDGIESCSLWGSWNGGWHLNQTDSNWNFGTYQERAEDFESVSPWNNWAEVGDATGCLWTRGTSTPSGSTGPTGGYGPTPSGSSYFLFTEASTGENCEYNSGNHWTSLESEILDADLYNITLDFWYHMYGAAMGSLYVDINESSGWSNIWSLTGQQQTTEGQNWEQASINLNSYSGQIQLRIRAVVGTAYTSDLSIDEATITLNPRYTKENGNFTLNISEEGNYKWNIECNDTLSFSSTAIQNFTVGLDFTEPQIEFISPTPSDKTNTSSTSLYIKVNITEPNLENLTFYLYDSTGLKSYQTYSNQTNHTFTSLQSKTYYYNATAYDKSGRKNSTETRQITVDAENPSATLLTPTHPYFTNNPTQNFTANVSDNLGLKEATLFIVNSTGQIIYSAIIGLTGLTQATIGKVYTFLYDDVFTWFYQIEDSVGNLFNSTSNQIEIDSTSPDITFIAPTQEAEAILNQDYIEVNTSIYEKNYKNITFHLFNDEQEISPSPLTFSDQTRFLNWTMLFDDTYYYNVTSFDTASNNGSSETRTITLDTTNPLVTFSPSSYPNNSVITGSEIYINVSVTEINEQNITFSRYGTSSQNSTFTDKRRAITWNLLPSGTYQYEVKVTDKVSLQGKTEKRTITLDNTPPIINYEYPTSQNNANQSQNWIFINLTQTEQNPSNITFYLYNSSGLISQQTYSNQQTYHNFTGLQDGTYYYNATALDKAGQSNSVSTRIINLDTTYPLIEFVPPTKPDSENSENNWVFLNTSVIEQNFNKIEFSIYNSDKLISSQTYYDITRSYNFTSLSSDIYYYNATAYDNAGNKNSTETRMIGLDFAGPNVQISKPRTRTYGYNESLPLEHTVYDQVSEVDSCWWNLDNGVNQSITCNEATTFNTTVASHTLYFYANDTFGNIGFDSVTFSISVTGPAIELEKPEDTTFYPEATSINFSFASNDPDETDTCSLYGDWSGIWQKNETYSGNWKNLGFKNRKNINITNTGSSTLSDFPIYLNISSSHTETGDYADILFFSGTCDSSGASLNYEIENYDTYYANVWIKTPSLTPGINQICMYYKNPDADNNENPSQVWSSSYTSVYHLDQASGAAIDSLGNFDAEDGIDPDSNMNVEGKIGGADYFDGSDYLGENPEWNVDGAHTYCAWVKFSSAHDGTILEDGGLTDGSGLGVTSTGELRYAECYNGAFNPLDSGTTYADNSWHYVCGGHTGSIQFLYVDGELAASATQGDGLSGTDDARIGSANSANPVFDDNTAHELVGYLDEIRISSTDRSSDWINQSYQLIANYDSLITLGEEQNFTAFSLLLSEEGSYLWNIECNDTIGYSSFALANYSFTIDVTDPQVFFGASTEANDTTTENTWIYANTNLIENNFKNITFFLYNQSALLDLTSFTDNTREINWTGLSSGTYYYNITVFDKASRSGDSETRIIHIDLSPPTGGLESPANNSYQKQTSQNLTATFSDTTGLGNATLYIFNQTGHLIYTATKNLLGATLATIGIVYNFLEEGIYHWFYSIQDTVGNTFQTQNNTLTIDTTSPLIDFTTGTEDSGQIFKRENIFVNITTSDQYLANTTFSLFDTSGPVTSHTFNDGTSQINWTLLPDETYFYNVTSSDLAGNINSTITRNITLDNTIPIIAYSTPPTMPNGAFYSSDTITVRVSVTEPNEENITFKLYNSTEQKIRQNTFTEGQRQVDWNLLSDGAYKYNVTILDKVGLSTSTTTRTIYLDNTPPQITYGYGTEPNNTFYSRNWIYQKVTITETNFQNVSLSLYNSTGLISKKTFSDTTREYNFTNLPDGIYTYSSTTYDKAGNSNTTQIRTITLDNQNPTIELVSPTLPINTNNTNDWIFVNTTSYDSNFKNITFYLHSSIGLVYSQTFSDTTREYNFTNLPSKEYYYNVTVYDAASNSNSTETRKIGLDYIGPTIQIIKPQAKAYGTNISLPLEHNIYDNIVKVDTCWYNIDNLENKTISCTSPTTFNTTDGTHTLHLFANDTLSNIGYKNITFLISTTGPAIQLISPADQTFYPQETEVFFNYTAEDPDQTESCSLWGSWNGGWHLNQTDPNWIFGTYQERDEDFESASPWNNWTEVGDATGCLWTRGTSTPSANTGPTGGYGPVPSGSSYFLFTEASSGQNCEFDAGNHWTSLESEILDADTYNITLDFWYHMYGAAMGSLYVDINESSGWSNIWSLTGQQQTTEGQNWEQASINLNSYSGQIQLRIRAVVGTAYTSDLSIDEATITLDPKLIRTQGNFTLNLSEEGSHIWNIQCNDTNGYETAGPANFTISFDVTNPLIDFGIGTLPDNSNVSQNFIYINSTITENNFKNMTFYLYNETSLVKTYFQNNTLRDHNFTGLQDTRYHYNITVYDQASRSNSTQTRTILLDTKNPTASPISPQNNLITNNATQNLTATLSDENGLIEAILYIFNQTGLVYSQIIPLQGQLSIVLGTVYTFLSDGIYSWFYQAEDTIGNKINSSNYTITIDTSAPQIEFILPTLPNNTYISQNFIYFNTSVSEPNFANITFNLLNGEGFYSSYSFTNSKRDINYTLLPDDEYFYSTIVFDKANNQNTSEIRTITLDNIQPTISYQYPTENNYANKSQNFITINTSVSEPNFANITFKLYIEETPENITTFADSTRIINFTNLADAIYKYNVTATDKAGNSKSLSTRQITLDTTDPILFFIDPTEPSGAVLEQETIPIKTFLTETNFKNITFYLYDNSGLLNQTTYTTPTTEIEFEASGTNKTYFYNATAFDIANNKDSTVTRNITLIDTTFPTLDLTSPQNKTYSYNKSIRINYNVFDLHLDKCWYSLDFGPNITITNCQSVAIDVADEQSHFLKVYANDTLGYTTSQNVTFFTNSSLVKIPETYSVQRGSIFTDGTSHQPIEEIHPTKGFILHTTRSSGSGPATLQVTSNFEDPGEIVFKNYESGSGVVVDWTLISGPNITVQRGEIDYTNELTLALSISQINLSNSFIIINNRLNSTDSSKNVDGFWTGKFSSDSSVTFQRGSNLANGTLSYQIVSWEGTNVQSKSSVIPNASPSSVEPTTQINENNSFMIFSKRISSTTIVQNSMIEGRIINSTHTEFQRTGSTGEANIELFVVESPLFKSQHGTHTHQITSSQQFAIIPNSLFNTTRSFSVQSNKNTGTLTSFANAYLTQNIYNKTSLVLQKGVGSAAGETSWSAIEITELDKPEINLISPINSQNFSIYTIPQFNFSIQDETQISNCSLYGNWSGGWHLNQTISSPERGVNLNFSGIVVDSDGYYSWNIECTDTYNNKGFSSLNFSFASFLPPTNPTIYNITQTSNDGTGEIIISWNKSDHSENYKIYAGETISTMSYIDETTQENYTDNSFAGSKRKFYQIKATNPTGQNLSEIFAAHLYELKHDTIKSRNWIAFPSNFTYLENANKTLEEIPNAIAFTTFNATTQSRVTCNEFSCPENFACTQTNCNFQIEAGKGYEVDINSSLEQEVNWSAVGKVYPQQTLNLKKNSTSFGKNWIAMYANTTLSSAQELILNIPGADSINRWNPGNQSSEGLQPSPIPWKPGFIGQNFQINIEEGYEVSVTSSTQWIQS